MAEELSEEVKAFIVTALAHRRAPRNIVEAVKEQYGVAVDRRHVHRYKPDAPGYDLGKQWVDLWKKERRAFDRRSVASVSLLSRGPRAAELQALYWDVREDGNTPLARQLLADLRAEEAAAAEAARAGGAAGVGALDLRLSWRPPSDRVALAGGKPAGGDAAGAEEPDHSLGAAADGVE